MPMSYLNTENIARSNAGIEYHPLRPFLPENARVLFLGSFPPQRKRWCMDFYYPNFINDHWRIEGEVFFADRNHFVAKGGKAFDLEAITSFCLFGHLCSAQHNLRHQTLFAGSQCLP